MFHKQHTYLSKQISCLARTSSMFVGRALAIDERFCTSMTYIFFV
jgi:hypothetical protein